MLKRKFPLIIISAAHALLMLFLLYVLGNLPYSLGGELALMQKLNIFRETVSPDGHNVPDDILPVNVSYDKELIDWVDDYGLPVGTMAITNRQKLLDFLTLAKASNNYRYILLDVFFEKGFDTPVDSALFATIASMDNIVIPCHNDGIIADTRLVSKSAIADYSTSIFENNFIKYEYFTRRNVSLAWKMYSDITGSKHSQFGPFVFIDKELSNKSLFLNLQINPGINAYSSQGEKQFYNLGEDLLNVSELINFDDLFKDRIIIVGDFTESDIHDTYLGKMPGGYINYNAYLQLEQGAHKVKWLSMLVLFIIYFLLSYVLLTRIRIFDTFPIIKSIKSKTFRFVLSLFGYTALFTVVCLLLYAIEGKMYDMLSLAVYMSILNTALGYFETIKNKK